MKKSDSYIMLSELSKFGNVDSVFKNIIYKNLINAECKKVRYPLIRKNRVNGFALSDIVSNVYKYNDVITSIDDAVRHLESTNLNHQIKMRIKSLNRLKRLLKNHHDAGHFLKGDSNYNLNIRKYDNFNVKLVHIAIPTNYADSKVLRVLKEYNEELKFTTRIDYFRTYILEYDYDEVIDLKAPASRVCDYKDFYYIVVTPKETVS